MPAGKEGPVSGDDDGFDAVEQYLRDELSEAAIEREDIPGRGVLLRVATAEFSCDVLVALEFVREHELGELAELLEEWDVLERVREGGLVIVTASGVTTDT